MPFESTQALTWIITFVGLAGFLFVGKKKWWAWYINLGCQILWTVYAFVTGQPAFLVSVVVFSVIFGINAYKWTREERASRKLRNGLNNLQVGETFEHGDVKFTRNEDPHNCEKVAGECCQVEEESNLVKHARHELELIGEEPAVIDWFARVIKEYASFGHSGGSAWATTGTLGELLRFRPLTELTDDPDEWVHHGSHMWPHGDKGVWQNKRDGRCFSEDGGKTYTCVDDSKDGVQKVYTSISKEQWTEDHAHVSTN